jgi:hypothetical protein
VPALGIFFVGKKVSTPVTYVIGRRASHGVICLLAEADQCEGVAMDSNMITVCLFSASGLILSAFTWAAFL